MPAMMVAQSRWVSLQRALMPRLVSVRQSTINWRHMLTTGQRREARSSCCIGAKQRPVGQAEPAACNGYDVYPLLTSNFIRHAPWHNTANGLKKAPR